MVIAALSQLQYAMSEPPSLRTEEFEGRVPKRLLERLKLLAEAREKGEATLKQIQVLLDTPGVEDLPRDVQASLHGVLGYTLQITDQVNEALASYNRAIELAPEYAFAYYNRGLAYDETGDLEAAIADYTRTIEQDPEFAAAYVNRAGVLIVSKRYEEALASLEKAYALRKRLPDHGEAAFVGAALAAIALGVSGIKKRWLPDAEAGIKAFIRWRDRARRDRQSQAFKEATEQFKKTLPTEDRDDFEEFMQGVRLLSIRDPFKAWKALAKEVGKWWPEGVSAVDAVREVRE